MVIFHTYVSLPEGMCFSSMIPKNYRYPPVIKRGNGIFTYIHHDWNIFLKLPFSSGISKLGDGDNGIVDHFLIIHGHERCI